MSRQVEIGLYLASLREQAGLKQNELARRIEWSPAVLSRVESGERPLDDDEMENVLIGIGTPEALKLREVLGRNWEILPSPPLTDPDADLLWEAEQVAKDIHSLAERPDVKQFFERRLVRYKEVLLAPAWRTSAIASLSWERLLSASPPPFAVPSGWSCPHQRECQRPCWKPGRGVLRFAKYICEKDQVMV